MISLKRGVLDGDCLGMQMLLTESEEHGIHRGLGYSGKVKKFQADGDVFKRKTPHIGWSALQLPNGVMIGATL